MHVINLLPKLQYIKVQCLLVDAAVQIVLMHFVTTVELYSPTTKETHHRFCQAIIFWCKAWWPRYALGTTPGLQNLCRKPETMEEWET